MRVEHWNCDFCATRELDDINTLSLPDVGIGRFRGSVDVHIEPSTDSEVQDYCAKCAGRVVLDALKQHYAEDKSNYGIPPLGGQDAS